MRLKAQEMIVVTKLMSRPPSLLLALVLALPCAAPAANAPAPGLPYFDLRRISAAAEVVLAVPDSTIFYIGNLPPRQSPRAFTVGTNPSVARSLDIHLADAAILEERLAAVDHQP